MATARRARRMLRRCALGLTSVALLSAPVRGATPPVTFELRTVKHTYLVGEPVVATLTIRGSAKLYLDGGHEELWREDAHFRLLVNRGQGFKRFRGKRLYSVAGWGEQKTQRNDGELGEYILSYDENIEDWLFPAPGTVQLMAEYEDADIGRIRSAAVTLEIKAAEGDEKVVHDALRAFPRIGPRVLVDLNVRDRHLSDEGMRFLVETYRSSVYLQGLRVRDLQARLSQVTDQVDPSDRLSPPAKDRQLREQLLRERWAKFLPEAEALFRDLEAGQFAPDAATTLASLYWASGDETRAVALYARVTREFPDRAAGREARKEVDDTEKPELAVTAAPSTLWPPNNKFVAVTVTVEVTDDSDPSPAVKLDSITCTDDPRRACVSAEDIVGAEYGTDDRQFELRAARLGASWSRTYTITYSAIDAAGNRATAATVVTVPHDQGKRGPGPVSP